MTYTEYKAELIAIQERMEQEKEALLKRYCSENNIYKKGDIISDSRGAIKIDKIQYFYGYIGEPGCLYSGPELKANGDLRKDKSRRSIHQSNLK